jgi:hypothetical protein
MLGTFNCSTSPVCSKSLELTWTTMITNRKIMMSVPVKFANSQCSTKASSNLFCIPKETSASLLSDSPYPSRSNSKPYNDWLSHESNASS